VAGQGVLGDPDQQQRQPAQQHVGADALLLAVVDRAQLEVGLHVAPAALDVGELFVPGRDVLCRERGVRGPQQRFAVQVGFAGTAAASTRSRPAGVMRR
jgi:hypothetical protein